MTGIIQLATGLTAWCPTNSPSGQGWNGSCSWKGRKEIEKRRQHWLASCLLPWQCQKQSGYKEKRFILVHKSRSFSPGRISSFLWSGGTPRWWAHCSVSCVPYDGWEAERDRTGCPPPFQMPAPSDLPPFPRLCFLIAFPNSAILRIPRASGDTFKIQTKVDTIFTSHKCLLLFHFTSLLECSAPDFHWTISSSQSKCPLPREHSHGHTVKDH